MRVLFAISLVSLAALLWASVSIAQHIYRSRLRQRMRARQLRPTMLARMGSGGATDSRLPKDVGSR
jgi:heme exporter protein D